jgi:hypothetical protein
MTCSLKSCEMAFVSEDQGARYFLTKPFEEACLRKILGKLSDEVREAATPGHGQHPASASRSTPQDPPALNTLRRNLPARHAIGS